jgi:hypothetical protein
MCIILSMITSKLQNCKIIIMLGYTEEYTSSPLFIYPVFFIFLLSSSTFFKKREHLWLIWESNPKTDALVRHTVPNQ